MAATVSASCKRGKGLVQPLQAPWQLVDMKQQLIVVLLTLMSLCTRIECMLALVDEANFASVATTIGNSCLPMLPSLVHLQTPWVS